ncbi:hypothetical protein C8Q76DRAFT_798979 [Earliella scabrosa]|nr:hypothetical protein C8Q76DRAFT_798979 [Earliella scabrosa]
MFIGRTRTALAKAIPATFPNVDIVRQFISPVLLDVRKYDSLRRPRMLDVAQLGVLCENHFSFGSRAEIRKTFRKLLWHDEVMRMLINEGLRRAGQAVETRNLLTFAVTKVDEVASTGYTLAHLRISDNGFNNLATSKLHGTRPYRVGPKASEADAYDEAERPLNIKIPALVVERARPKLVNPDYDAEGYLYGHVNTPLSSLSTRLSFSAGTNRTSDRSRQLTALSVAPPSGSSSSSASSRRPFIARFLEIIDGPSSLSANSSHAYASSPHHATKVEPSAHHLKLLDGAQHGTAAAKLEIDGDLPGPIKPDDATAIPNGYNARGPAVSRSSKHETDDNVVMTLDGVQHRLLKLESDEDTVMMLEGPLPCTTKTEPGVQAHKVPDGALHRAIKSEADDRASVVTDSASLCMKAVTRDACIFVPSDPFTTRAEVHDDDVIVLGGPPYHAVKSTADDCNRTAPRGSTKPDRIPMRPDGVRPSATKRKNVSRRRMGAKRRVDPDANVIELSDDDDVPQASTSTHVSVRYGSGVIDLTLDE